MAGGYVSGHAKTTATQVTNDMIVRMTKHARQFHCSEENEPTVE